MARREGHVLRVPLHGEEEVVGRLLLGERLGDAVGGEGRDDELRRAARHRLVVAAVDPRGAGGEGAAQRSPRRTGVDQDLVRFEILRRHLVGDARVGHLGREVLDQGSAAGDVDELQPAADRKDRQPRGAGRGVGRQLAGVARGIELEVRRAHRLAVAVGLEVLAAAEEKPVDPGDHRGGLVLVLRQMKELLERRPGGPQGANVIVVEAGLVQRNRDSHGGIVAGAAVHGKDTGRLRSGFARRRC